MPKIDCTELQRLLARLALSIGTRPGVRNIDDVVAAMRKDIPEVTRQEVVDSIVAAHSVGPREVSELTKKINALKNEARRTSEPRRRDRLKGQIADLQKQLDAGPTLPELKPEPATTKELTDLAYKRDLLRRQIRARIDSLRPRGFWRKTGEGMADALNGARAVMTSELLPIASSLLRQGGFVTLGHPVMAAKAVPSMFRAFFDPKKAHAQDAALRNRNNAARGDRAGLDLTSMDGTLSGLEETAMSRLVGKIPLVAGNQRAYIAGLNKIRADLFDALTETRPDLTAAEDRHIAAYINAATGRGDLGALRGSAVALNTVFFSPRYLASRVQLLANPALGFRFGGGGTLRTRALVAREYARYLAGVGVVYAIGKMAGGVIGTDPRSSDFGKIRFGDTRLDPLSGLSQMSVLVGRMVTGETASPDGTVRKVPFDTTAARFLRNKLAPVPAAAWDIRDIAVGQKPPPGHPTTIPGVAGKMVTPMSFGDVAHAMEEHGMSKGSVLAVLSLFGMGLQTYEREDAKEKPASQAGSRYRDLVERERPGYSTVTGR